LCCAASRVEINTYIQLQGQDALKCLYIITCRRNSVRLGSFFGRNEIQARTPHNYTWGIWQTATFHNARSPTSTCTWHERRDCTVAAPMARFPGLRHQNIWHRTNPGHRLRVFNCIFSQNLSKSLLTIMSVRLIRVDTRPESLRNKTTTCSSFICRSKRTLFI